MLSHSALRLVLGSKHWFRLSPVLWIRGNFLQQPSSPDGVSIARDALVRKTIVQEIVPGIAYNFRKKIEMCAFIEESFSVILCLLLRPHWSPRAGGHGTARATFKKLEADPMSRGQHIESTYWFDERGKKIERFSYQKWDILRSWYSNIHWWKYTQSIKQKNPVHFTAFHCPAVVYVSRLYRK